VYLIAPGEFVDPSGLEEAEGWAVFFPPEVLGSQPPGAFLSWRPPSTLSLRAGRGRRCSTHEGAT